MTANIDYTSPSTNFTYDVNRSNFFRKDAQNYINVLGIKQLNTLENTSLLDIYLSTGNVVEPHIHQNAAELVYCISGSAVVSLLNPFTNQILNLPIKPGQVANIPQAWWHYEIATADNTHLLAIFNAPTPEVIFGSNILRLTPAHMMAHTYCLNEQQWKQAVSPIQSTTVIGPPANCNQNREIKNHPTQPLAQQQNPYHQDSYYFPLYWGY
ncbi:cupin [Bacillus cereus]|uniref:cupin domain-containing protein n=1 Tax=Bacillus cereus TaxID=1396 RepID=UPI0007B69DA8|nr:cupin domain-containing protein [Bacillus cereus]MRC32059.1 cupin domain-containing protein [Bacillus thuringiensis]ANC19460.1 cupin [Bacillus cereus]MDA2480056.1 cupin domain-containing protein [Bacillus cereus]MDA2497050.1 cupin domain-containing protein [Bacillus cereus]HDR8042945.1 cupin domain-containing protein [Bacillus cereus]